MIPVPDDPDAELPMPSDAEYLAQPAEEDADLLDLPIFAATPDDAETMAEEDEEPEQ